MLIVVSIYIPYIKCILKCCHNREIAARNRTRTALRTDEVVPQIAFSPWVDPAGWLGRQYTAYEHSLMMGPEPKCSKFSKVKIGSLFYRTKHGDQGKRTTQCFVRAMFPKTDHDADQEWEDRCDLNHASLHVSFPFEYLCNMYSTCLQYLFNVPAICIQYTVHI